MSIFSRFFNWIFGPSSPKSSPVSPIPPAIPPQPQEPPVTHNNTSFDFTDDLLVFTGTIYGEIRDGTVAQMEDVAQVILNRVAVGRGGNTIHAVCLAPLQFSCWNTNDPNRNDILNAQTNDPSVWATCKDVAANAMAGKNPNRVGSALNYFANSDPSPPYWAVPPAHEVYNDGLQSFWEGA